MWSALAQGGGQGDDGLGGGGGVLAVQESGNSYLEDFDRKEFFTIFAKFGVPFILCYALAILVLAKVNFKLKQLPAWVAQSNRIFGFANKSEDAFERWIPWISGVAYLLLLLPLVFLFVWGVVVYDDISKLLGLAIILIGLGLILLVYGSLLWKWNHWRINSVTRIAFCLSFISALTFLIWAIFVHRPFTYLGTSSVFVFLNMIPTSIALYLSAMENVRRIEDYPEMQMDVMGPSVFLERARSTDARQHQSKLGALTTNAASTIGRTITAPIEWSFRVPKVIMTLLSLGILVAYAVVVRTEAVNGRNVGFITAGAVLVGDLIAYILVWTEKIRSPLAASFAMLLSRAFLVIFGEELWFVGHAVMYFLLMIYFLRLVLDNHLPADHTQDFGLTDKPTGLDGMFAALEQAEQTTNLNPSVSPQQQQQQQEEYVQQEQQQQQQQQFPPMTEEEKQKMYEGFSVEQKQQYDQMTPGQQLQYQQQVQMMQFQLQQFPPMTEEQKNQLYASLSEEQKQQYDQMTPEQQYQYQQQVQMMQYQLQQFPGMTQEEEKTMYEAFPPEQKQQYDQMTPEQKLQYQRQMQMMQYQQQQQQQQYMQQQQMYQQQQQQMQAEQQQPQVLPEKQSQPSAAAEVSEKSNDDDDDDDDDDSAHGDSDRSVSGSDENSGRNSRGSDSEDSPAEDPPPPPPDLPDPAEPDFQAQEGSENGTEASVAESGGSAAPPLSSSADSQTTDQSNNADDEIKSSDAFLVSSSADGVNGGIQEMPESKSDASSITPDFQFDDLQLPPQPAEYKENEEEDKITTATLLGTTGFVQPCQCLADYGFGRWILQNMDSVACIILTLLFVGDLLFTWNYSDSTIELDRSHRQYIAGIISISCVLLIFLGMLSLRMYHNRRHRFDQKMVIVLGVTYTAAVGAAILGWFLTKSYIVTFLFVFMPLIIGLTYGAFLLWVDQDYYILPRKGRKGRFQPDVHVAGIPWWRRYLLLELALADFILIGLMGGLISAFAGYPVVGYGLAGAIYLFLFTAIPVIEWFETFEFSRNLQINLGMSILVFLGMILMVWQIHLEGETTNTALGLLIFLFMYPTVVLSGTALYKYYDDGYRTSRYTQVCAWIGGTFTVMALTLIALVYEPWEIGATGLLLFGLLLAASFVWPRIREWYVGQLVKSQRERRRAHHTRMLERRRRRHQQQQQQQQQMEMEMEMADGDDGGRDEVKMMDSGGELQRALEEGGSKHGKTGETAGERTAQETETEEDAAAAAEEEEPIKASRLPPLSRIFFYARLLIFLTVLVFAILVALEDDRGFLGFSLMMMTFWLSFAWVVLDGHFKRVRVSHNPQTGQKQETPFASTLEPVLSLQSPNIFPVYEYHPDWMGIVGGNPSAAAEVSGGGGGGGGGGSGGGGGVASSAVLEQNTNLRPCNDKVISIYACLLLQFLWGVVACFFLTKVWIGLGVATLTLVVGVFLTLEMKLRPLVTVHRAVSYLAMTPSVYRDAIARAKLAASSQASQMLVLLEQQRLARNSMFPFFSGSRKKPSASIRDGDAFSGGDDDAPRQAADGAAAVKDPRKPGSSTLNFRKWLNWRDNDEHDEALLRREQQQQTSSSSSGGGAWWKFNRTKFETGPQPIPDEVLLMEEGERKSSSPGGDDEHPRDGTPAEEGKREVEEEEKQQQQLPAVAVRTLSTPDSEDSDAEVPPPAHPPQLPQHPEPMEGPEGKAAGGSGMGFDPAALGLAEEDAPSSSAVPESQPQEQLPSLASGGDDGDGGVGKMHGDDPSSSSPGGMGEELELQEQKKATEEEEDEAEEAEEVELSPEEAARLEAERQAELARLAELEAEREEALRAEAERKAAEAARRAKAEAISKIAMVEVAEQGLTDLEMIVAGLYSVDPEDQRLQNFGWEAVKEACQRVWHHIPSMNWTAIRAPPDTAAYSGMCRLPLSLEFVPLLQRQLQEALENPTRVGSAVAQHIFLKLPGQDWPERLPRPPVPVEAEDDVTEMENGAAGGAAGDVDLEAGLGSRGGDDHGVDPDGDADDVTLKQQQEQAQAEEEVKLETEKGFEEEKPGQHANLSGGVGSSAGPGEEFFLPSSSSSSHGHSAASPEMQTVAAEVEDAEVWMHRRFAFQLLLKLSYRESELHYLQNRWVTHLQLELIMAANALRQERQRMMLRALRDPEAVEFFGGMDLSEFTLEYIGQLPVESPVLRKLDQWLDIFIGKEARESEAILDRRAEELRAQRERDRQALLRARAEEEAREAARLASEAKKQESLRLYREQLQASEREAAEHSAHVLQEKAELQTQLQSLSSEIAALLLRLEESGPAEGDGRGEEAKTAAEDARLKLDALRTEKDLVEEKLCLLEEEEGKLQQLRREEERRKALDPSQYPDPVQKALKSNCCTLAMAGHDLVRQPWYECKTCGMGTVCLVCSREEHSSHHLVSSFSPPPTAGAGPLTVDPNSPESPPPDVSPIFCDCGSRGCHLNVYEPSVDAIVEECRRSGKQWVDPDFPPSQESLFRSQPPSTRRRSWAEFRWARPEDMLTVQRSGGKVVVFKDDVEADDIEQGQLGDCYFLSALSVMAQRPEKVHDVYITKDTEDAGVFAVRFFVNGQRVTVLVDSFFPVTPDKRRPVFGRSKDAQELWVMIAEKAYAKLQRSYEAIEGGLVDQALVDLTGGIGNRYDMRKPHVKQMISNGQLWRMLLSFHEAGHLLGAGTPAGSDAEADQSPMGIIQGHAYSILQVRAVDGLQLIQLRNPWGRVEWKGRFSDDSPEWTRRLRAKLNVVSADDGTFWMDFIDFVQHFEDIYVCRFFDEGWGRCQIKGSWTEENAGGCTNFDSVHKNPQYLLHIRRDSSHVVMQLSQDDRRLLGEKNHAIAIELYDNEGRRVTRYGANQQMVASNPDSYILSRSVTLETELPIGLYTILISTFYPGQTSNWDFRVFVKGDPHPSLVEAPPAEDD